MRFTALAPVTIALLIGVSVRAENWPEFRGPTGQGTVPNGGLPTDWNTTKNVVWKQVIPGTGWSSPIIHNGRIYLTASVPIEKDQSLQALCIDAGAGKILWAKEVFRQDGSTAPRIHGKNGHASPTPVTDGQRLYVHFGHQGTACLDLMGKVLWQNTELKYQPVHGNGGSPILVDDALIFNVDGSDEQLIVALDRDTGKLRWKTERNQESPKKFSFSTPLLISVDGKQQVISPASGMVAAYDPRTGQETWRVRYDGYSVVPRPVYGHGLVFVSSGYETPNLLAIRPNGQGDVTDTHIAWQTHRGAPHTPSPLLVEEELYTVSDDGIATCFDAKTGRVHWKQRINGNYSASPMFGDGKIYFQSEEGDGVVIKAGRQFEVLAKNSLDERTLASYAAADGALFIRTEKHLYRIHASK